MLKRPANDTLLEEQPASKAQPSSSRRDLPAEDEIGEFEDAWEDELESDDDNGKIQVSDV
jgi:ribosome assembly protein RRB1